MCILAKYHVVWDMLTTIQLLELENTDYIAFVGENTHKTLFELDS